jgi:hypothetical protein
MSKDQMILWTRTVSRDELSKIQANLQNQVEQQAAFGARGQSARELIALHLKNFFIRYNSVDRFLLSDRQAVLMWVMLHLFIPGYIASMRTRLTQIAADEREKKAKVARKATKRILRLRILTIDTYPQQLIERKTISVQAKEDVPQVMDEFLQTQVKSLYELAEKAQKNSLTSEDRFIVEQAVSSYLPEAVRLYSQLQDAPDNMQEEVEEVFLHHLTLIEDQLNAVNGRGAQNALKELKAQTQFLEAKAPLVLKGN